MTSKGGGVRTCMGNGNDGNISGSKLKLDISITRRVDLGMFVYLPDANQSK